jgi:hypothetical protein
MFVPPLADQIVNDQCAKKYHIEHHDNDHDPSNPTHKMFLFPFHFNGSGLIMGIRKERSRLVPAYAPAEDVVETSSSD